MKDYCPISKECNYYEQYSITCNFLYGLCRHKRHYEKMDYKELLLVIQECREELRARGTITKFQTIHCKTKKIMEDFKLERRTK